MSMYNTIANIVINNETYRRITSDVDESLIMPYPKSDNTAVHEIIAAFESVQGLSNQADVWLFVEDSNPDDGSDRAAITDVFLQIACIDSDGAPDPYIAAHRELLSEYMSWMIRTLKLDPVEDPSAKFGELSAHIMNNYHTLQYMFKLNTLSARWAYAQLSGHGEYFNIAASSNGLIVNVGDELIVHRVDREHGTSGSIEILACSITSGGRKYEGREYNASAEDVLDCFERI